MRRLLVPILGVATVIALIVGPVVYAVHEEKATRNFRVVREGVLYRSAQMTLPGLKRAFHDYGIRTVISLRYEDRPDDLVEEEFCRKEEVAFYRLPPKHWDTTDGPAEAEPNVRKFRDIISDPDNYPILVHCFAGIHRTGAYVAIYRMEREHWTNEAAIAEVQALGYDHLDVELDVLGYLEQYRPTWKESAEPPAALPAKARSSPRKRGAKKVPAWDERGLKVQTP
jgi:tyrosine-protein phosphatase SIW14